MIKSSLPQVGAFRNILKALDLMGCQNFIGESYSCPRRFDCRGKVLIISGEEVTTFFVVVLDNQAVVLHLRFAAEYLPNQDRKNLTAKLGKETAVVPNGSELVLVRRFSLAVTPRQITEWREKVEELLQADNSLQPA
jgi:hypothetical protein